MRLTLTEYIHGVDTGVLQAHDVVSAYMKKATENTHNAWTHLHEKYVTDHIHTFDSRSLRAAPIGIKDNILTEGYTSTCGSKILSGYISSYSAHCFEQLEEAGGLMLGKTNMDEFAMGSSTEHSAYGNTLNPLDNERVPGGSSGGSAVAVAGDECLAALGTETGGSVRQPASLCGIIGVKPSYGRISRYGVQAMAASINQVGTLTKTVEDAVTLFDAVSGYDPKDAKSVQRDDTASWSKQLTRDDLQGVRLAVPHQFINDQLDDTIKHVCLKAIEVLKNQGAEVRYIDLPILNYVVPAYYIIVPAEVSTDMARFDGMRFGLQDDTMDYDHIYDYYESIRKEGFGNEVKRRIMVGSYVLSAGYYDAYYHKAQLVVQKMKQELQLVYKDFDAIIGPTTPSVAWKFGEKGADPIQMYLEDIYTIPANLTGLPAISVPVGNVVEGEKKLPVGLQIMTNMWDEAQMFGIAHQLEKHVGFKHPDLHFTH